MSSSLVWPSLSVHPRHLTQLQRNLRPPTRPAGRWRTPPSAPRRPCSPVPPPGMAPSAAQPPRGRMQEGAARAGQQRQRDPPNGNAEKHAIANKRAHRPAQAWAEPWPEARAPRATTGTIPAAPPSCVFSVPEFAPNLPRICPEYVPEYVFDVF